ncbi:MAG: hypothetical protein E6H54_05790 [Betaproteobacteria bacterium]|nr:MAG: hypothetical protein E6H54_05790 [Betaproteobacteria bacterium]
MTDFRALIEALSKAQVRFVLVGGAAATVHGSSRLTQDIDIVYARDASNLANLVHALSPLKPYLRGAPPGLPFKFDVQTLSRGLNFTFSTSVGDIDLLGEIAGIGDYEAMTGHTIEVAAFGARFLCLDLATLIKAKTAAGRPRDLEAIAELRALQQEIEKRRGG